MERQIQWYPGHMAKAKRQLGELLKYLDVILEIRDARIPLASHNGDLDALLERRPRIVILNKVDLADPSLTKAWQEWFRGQKMLVLTVNGQNGQGVNQIWKLLEQELPAPKVNRPRRIGVVGIPNVGKSSILNRLLGTGAAKTGNMPGVTRGKQWIRRGNFEVLDLPGLLPPKIQSDEDGLKLAMLGAIREELIPAYDLALLVLERYGAKLFNWTELDSNFDSPEAGLEWYAKKRGFLSKGGEIDEHRAILALLKDFRDGRLGRISLESPN